MAHDKGVIDVTCVLAIKAVFRLGDGTTALACEGKPPVEPVAGARADLVDGRGQARQAIELLGERSMLNAATGRDLCVLETRDTVDLSQDEAQQGSWTLTLQTP